MSRYVNKPQRFCQHCSAPLPLSNRSRVRCFCSRECYRVGVAANFSAKLTSNSANDTSSDCILWTGLKDKAGYGIFGLGHVGATKAHRIAFEVAHGTFDKTLFVCHKCDNPSCVNPDHLFLGTHQDNMDDMKSKGRGNVGHRHGLSKLTEEQVIVIRRLRDEGQSLCGIAKQYGIHRETVRGIVNRTRWKHI